MEVSSSFSSQSASDALAQQLRVQQVKRSADQAEATARALRQQAGDAQQSADRARENARSLTVEADKAQGKAGTARQQLASLSSVTEVQEGISALREKVSSVIQAIDAPTPAPVVNAEGQTTGTVVNVTA
jgi:hypothetical protein